MPIGKYDTAEARWAGVGPYYAMFPTTFANEVIGEYTKPGDIVLDPFAGRFTSVFSAAIQGRTGLGIEVNPVGWVYGKAKLRAASREKVEARLQQMLKLMDSYSNEAEALPIFFHHCFSLRIRKFLLAARNELNWRKVKSDWTLMALLLIYLHGKLNQSFSNQMRQTKSMAPEYSVKWWQQRGLTPPEIDPLEFMVPRIAWRYAKGIPAINGSRIYLGNCVSLIRNVAEPGSVRLLFTSPPYMGVTNYHYDQWIRLWLLGFPPFPQSALGPVRGRFSHAEAYEALLQSAFQRASTLLTKEAVVYVRTGRRRITRDVTLRVLKQVFPSKKIRQLKQPSPKKTQTHLFRNRGSRNGDVDIILE